MVLPGDEDDCGACGPAGLHASSTLSVQTALFAFLPFFATFVAVALVALQRLFPILSGDQATQGLNGRLPLFTTAIPRSPKSNLGRPDDTRKLSAAAFAATIALTTVLAELVLCEISNTIDPTARRIALQFTVFLLLILLVAVIPSLEIQSMISSSGLRYFGPESGRFKIAWWLQAWSSMVWLLIFVWSRSAIHPPHREQDVLRGESWIHMTTEHLGVIGILLMGLLSGSAAVSAPWQSFGVQVRPISETALSRKQVGLDSTNEMLATKRSRLRAIEQKMAQAPPESFLKKVAGTFRGGNDAAERRNLEIEIHGLENMAVTLAAHHSVLSSRFHEQQRARTPTGKLIRTAYRIFAIYCIYRVLAALVTFVRRRLADDSEHFVGADPVNNILALLVKHYDSNLDRDLWAQQLSFLMSGVMLLASFSSVLQTFHLLARFLPQLLKAMQVNLALIVAQICGTYVLSAALLLRGIMPGEVVSNRLLAVGSTDAQWVDGWFEAWFLAGVALTAAGIWLGRKLADDDDWDDNGGVELGGKIM